MRTILAREAEKLVRQLEQVLSSHPPEKEQALALASKISDLRAQQFKQLVTSIVDVRQALTKEQLHVLTTGTTKTYNQKEER